MKNRYLSQIIVAILAILTANPAQSRASLDPVIQELLTQDLADLGDYVYSASREETSIQNAPSVVSVITAADIKQQGLKSLRDILDRVTGAFNQWDRNFSLVGMRGYAQDPTNTVLLLIDGHSINSQAGEGIGNTHLLPFLYQVKRIEIIRGPGSTLWGGDASFGIINIITYRGSDLAVTGEHNFKAHADYEFDMERKIYNLLYGTQFEEGDLMLSASYTESEGNNLTFYDIHANDLEVVNPNLLVRHDQHRPSYEVQAKGNWRDFSFNARSFEHKGYYRNVGPTIENEYREYEFDFFELGYNAEPSRNLSWETNVYFNQIDEAWRRKLTDGSIAWAWIQGYDELGLSSILTYRPTDHLLKAGIQLANRDFDGRRLTSGVSTVIVPASISGREINYALFADYTYSGIEDWRFVLGGRLQHFDLRQKGDYFLPRAALIHQLSDNWVVKYAYNTGVAGTTLNRTQSTKENYIVQQTGRILLGPEKPQRTKSHDILFSYNSDTLQANLGYFHQRLEDFIITLPEFDTGETLDGYELWMREDNVGDLKSNGIELDLNWKLTQRWDVYGNYSYVQTKYDKIIGTSSRGGAYNLALDSAVATQDKRLTGIPEHIWNFGINYSPSDHSSLNLHYRGWSKAWGRQNTQAGSGYPLFERYGPEHFFDLALNVDDFLNKDTHLQIYARNIFDNKAIYPMTVHVGATQGNGVEYGIGLSYEF
jgi:outer membrane receptor for ferrienterochelin and colicin